jgi:type IV pilus assembly protein PilM
MGALLRRALDQEGIHTTHAIVDVPREQAILNTLSLPCRNPEDLPGMVSIQIAKHLPFAVGDAEIDFAVAPHEPDAAAAEVLVAAVRHEILQQYQAIFEKSGLKLVRVGLRPFANRVAACELLKHAVPEHVLFVDVRPTLTEINVLRRSFLAFSRAASVQIPEKWDDRPRLSIVREDEPLDLLVASGDARKEDVTVEPVPTRIEDVVASLVVEVTRSIEAYRVNAPGAKMDHAVIGGDLGVEEALAEALQQKLGITAELYNPARCFQWEPDEGASASAFAATLGLVLGHAVDEALQFDFLHPKKAVSAAERRLKKAPLAAAAVIMLIVGGVATVAAVTKPDRDRLAAIERKIADLKGKQKEHEKFLSLVAEARAFDADQHIWVDVLYDVVTNLPPQEEMLITQVDLNQKEGRVLLKTRAKQRDTATDTVRRLNDFRRDNRTKPRFRAGIRGQTEKPGETYPIVQELTIVILDDSERSKGPESGPKSGGETG